MTIRKINEKMIDPTLVQKVNDHTALLAEKAKQTDLLLKADKTVVDSNYSVLDTKINSQASGSPKGVYATLSALQAAFPTGNTNTYVVSADGKWYYWNASAWTIGGTYQGISISKGAVSVGNTDFVKLGKNLFDKYNIIQGKLYAYLTGATSDNASYASTVSYVPIEPSTTYFRSGRSAVIIFYDANKAYISGVTFAEGTFTTPANAVYFRASTHATYTNVMQIEKGTVATAYEPFALNIDYLKINLEPNSVTATQIKTGTITKELLGFSVPEAILTKNLFNKNTASIGYFINQTTGALSASALHAASDFIKVTPLSKYSFISNASGRIAFYTINKTFISGLLAPVMPITIPANCEYIIFSFPTSSLSFDTQQFELSDSPTAFEPFGYTLPNLIDSTSLADPVILNLPPKLYGLVGQELNIYFDNIVSGRDTDYTFDVVCGKGQQYTNFWRFVPDVAESRSITITVYKDTKAVASKSSTIIVSSPTVGNGVTKNVIVIGDSTTDNENGVRNLNVNFSSDVMNINTLGTRGTGINKHEGRSGWTTELYVTVATATSGLGVVVPNAFWNPNTSAYDFSYYISNNALAVPDYVIINLGINDVFAVTSDAALQTKMTTMITQYQAIIASIRAYNANIKIGLALTIPPNYSQDAFGKSYNSLETRSRYKRNNVMWVAKLIETFSNAEANNTYLVPIHTNLDTRYNMGLEEVRVNARNTATFTSPIGNGGVHPIDSGYWQVDDVKWYWLKSFEV